MTKQNKNLLLIGLGLAFLYWRKTNKKEVTETKSGSDQVPADANSGKPEVTLVKTKIPEIYSIDY